MTIQRWIPCHVLMVIIALELRKFALNAQPDTIVQVKTKSLKYAQEVSKALLEKLNALIVLMESLAFRLMLKAKLIAMLDSIE